MPTEILEGAAAVAEGAALAPRRQKSPEHLARVNEAAGLVGRAFDGNRYAMLQLQEALSTSDFPILFGEVLDRELMAQYQDMTPVWQQFARRTVVRDFRPKQWVDLLGGRAALDPVAQLAEYPARKMTEAEYTLKVGKYGARIPLSWEMFVNDDLDAFRDAPNRLAAGARDTEDRLGTALVAGASGPNQAFFGADNTNGPLTTDNLTTGLTKISTRRDSDGRPIMVSAAILMIPPALEVAARNILGATEIRMTNANNQTTIVGNWLSGKVTIVVNPWLPVLDTSANSATTWYLLPAPSNARPALTLGFLRGHEVPDLRVKSDTGNRVGGGAIPAEDGSFDTDDIQYRVRHVTGGATLDPMTVYASDGTGTPAS